MFCYIYVDLHVLNYKIKMHSQLVIATYNKILEVFENKDVVPCGIQSDSKLAKKLDVSRTTIYKAIQILNSNGIILLDEHSRILLRRPKPKDFISAKDTNGSKSNNISRLILQKLSKYELKPGQRFSELELSKEFNCSTVTVRESLLKIAQSGIINKIPGQKWEVMQFTENVIEEIARARLVYEIEAINSLKLLSDDASVWNSLEKAKIYHKQLIENEKFNIKKLAKAERMFHFSLLDACNNSFLKVAYESVFLLVHYHIYQIEYDKGKIEKVVRQHLEIINMLLEKKFDTAIEKLGDHLDHARESMLSINKTQQLNNK